MTRYCPSCQQEKDISNYGKNNSYKDGYQVYCDSCLKKKRTEYYNKNKQKLINKSINYYNKRKKLTQDWIIKYLSEHSCEDCGESDIVVLQFDHPEGEKLFSLGDNLGRCSLQKYITEASRCSVVCANCHVRRTAKQQLWWRLN